MKKIWLYHSTSFLAAFLLFQVQPMVSKAMLPGFGGSYLVWGSCMVFFQAMLLLGYVYAHMTQRVLGVRRYSRLHWCVLALPVFCFPFRFDHFAESVGTLPLALSVFVLLLMSVGVPFLVLSTTSVLLQRWLSVSDLPEREHPYGLYSASNLGSMAALLTYPTLVEPYLGLRTQGYLWWGAYAVLVGLQILCSLRVGSSVVRGEEEVGDHPSTAHRAGRSPFDCAQGREVGGKVTGGSGIGNRRLVSWFMLSMAACAMLLAVTNVLTLDVASVPFLWVLPLCLYLLSFVVTFKQRVWCPSWLVRLLPWALMVGVVLRLMAHVRIAPGVVVAIVLHVGILFVVCVNCNAALIRRRPADPKDLTTFYLVISAGGLAGGLLVSWVVPLVSTTIIEYPLALALAAWACAGKAASGEGRRLLQRVCVRIGVVASVTLVPYVMVHGGVLDPAAEGVGSILLCVTALPLCLLLLYVSQRLREMAAAIVLVGIAFSWTESLAAGARQVAQLRNYYGVYRVYDRDGLRYLQHGTTQHGRQYLEGPKRRIPLAYFHPSTPAGRVLGSDACAFQKVGMIGLGTGALATYFGEGQSFRVFELDPDNLPIAETYFSYLEVARQNGATLSFVFGDGRVAMKQESAASYDLIIIDAFNSGSIPVHLLTVEAMEEYFRLLKPRGLLLMHVSNRVLSLEPVVYSNAEALGVIAAEASNADAVHPDAEYTQWMALSRDLEVHRKLAAVGWIRLSRRRVAAWTDQYSNIFGVLLKGER